MTKKLPIKIYAICSLLCSALLLLASSYQFHTKYPLLQSLVLIAFYFLAINYERSLSMLGILSIVLSSIFIKVPIQTTEYIRGILFCLVLIFLSGERRKITPALTLLVSWFVYITLELIKIKFVEDLVIGIFPVATKATIEMMFFEIIGISLIELLTVKTQKNNKNENLFGYQANILILATSVISYLIFHFAIQSIILDPNAELRNMPNPSALIILITLAAIVTVSILAENFNQTFENIFAHLELSATPDSGFLTLSRKPALALNEYIQYSKSIRKKSEALANSRKKTSELKVENAALKRQIQESSEKFRDLSIMADSINFGLLALTNDGTITYVNRIFYELLGLDVSQAEMLHFNDLIINENERSINVLKCIDSYFENGSKISQVLGDIKIEINEWFHQESSKGSINMGSKRIFIFLKKINTDSANKQISIPEA